MEMTSEEAQEWNARAYAAVTDANKLVTEALLEVKPHLVAALRDITSFLNEWFRALSPEYRRLFGIDYHPGVPARPVMRTRYATYSGARARRRMR